MSVKVIKEKLSAKNKHFWSLQKRDQRTAIAAEVISQIKAKKMLARTGHYFIIGTKSNDNTLITASKVSKLDKIMEKEGCTVCALGACFAGIVDLGDKVQMEEMFYEYSFTKKAEFDRDVNVVSMKNKIREVFTPEQMSLIESAFERKIFKDEGLTITSEFRANRRIAVDFSKLYKTDEDRLLAIMQNIRKNRGTFIPTLP